MNDPRQPGPARRRIMVRLAWITVALMAGSTASFQASGQSAFDRMFDAVDANQPAEVRTLLAQGIDVNTVDRDGNSLLARAAQRGYREVATLLLASGARIESRNRFGETPLMFAALAGNEGIVRDLLARQARTRSDAPSWTPLHYAALRGHAGVLALLIDAGGDVNGASENGTTPLMLAASEGRLDAVALLLKRGADATRTTDGGRTAGAWARSAGHKRIADMIDAAPRK
jgi:uncharacterized protein